jgi:hypothetical protein
VVDELSKPLAIEKRQLADSFVWKLVVTYVVGSSKNKTNGLSINSRAIDKRFFCPPDSFEHLVFFENVK